MSSPDPRHDPENTYKNERPSKKEKSSYAKKLRGAVYKYKQENSPLGQLKKLTRNPATKESLASAKSIALRNKK